MFARLGEDAPPPGMEAEAEQAATPAASLLCKPAASRHCMLGQLRHTHGAENRKAVVAVAGGQ